MKIKRIEKMNYIIDHEFEPVRAHSLDAGLDLRTPVDVTIPAHGSAIADLGIHLKSLRAGSVSLKASQV